MILIGMIDLNNFFNTMERMDNPELERTITMYIIEIIEKAAVGYITYYIDGGRNKTEAERKKQLYVNDNSLTVSILRY